MQTSTAATISDLTPVAQALLVIADAMMSDGRVNVLDASERETLEAALTRTMQGEIYGTGLADLLGTIVVRLAKPYRKPRVVAEGEDLYRVSFNDAVTWTVAYAVNSYGDLEWTATGSYSDLTFAWLPSPTPSFRASSADEAFGTIAGYYLNAPVWGELADVHALAEKCEHDRTLYTKTIKRIAKQRFNVKLSARGSRGTGYSWVYIDVAREQQALAEVAFAKSNPPISIDGFSLRPLGDNGFSLRFPDGGGYLFGATSRAAALERLASEYDADHPVQSFLRDATLVVRGEA